MSLPLTLHLQGTAHPLTMVEGNHRRRRTNWSAKSYEGLILIMCAEIATAFIFGIISRGRDVKKGSDLLAFAPQVIE